MEFNLLIQEYRACEKALYEAIETDDIASIRELDIRMTWLRNVIRDFPVESAGEKRSQVGFFMESVSAVTDLDSDKAPYSDLKTVIERYIEPRGTNGSSDAIRDAIFELFEHGRPRADALASLERSDLRIAAFGTDLRYTYTSPANGRFHDMPPEAFRGKHVEELIGARRFDKRARAYFEKCFAGKEQCYYYYLDSKRHGRQLLECRMLPQREPDGGTAGAVLVMRDLTDGVLDPIRSAEENRV